MAIHQSTSHPTFDCPSCSGLVAPDSGSWACEECGHVPHHGAD